MESLLEKYSTAQIALLVEGVLSEKAWAVRERDEAVRQLAWVVSLYRRIDREPGESYLTRNGKIDALLSGCEDARVYLESIQEL